MLGTKRCPCYHDVHARTHAQGLLEPAPFPYRASLRTRRACWSPRPSHTTPHHARAGLAGARALPTPHLTSLRAVLLMCMRMRPRLPLPRLPPPRLPTDQRGGVQAQERVVPRSRGDPEAGHTVRPLQDPSIPACALFFSVQWITFRGRSLLAYERGKLLTVTWKLTRRTLMWASRPVVVGASLIYGSGFSTDVEPAATQASPAAHCTHTATPPPPPPPHTRTRAHAHTRASGTVCLWMHTDTCGYSLPLATATATHSPHRAHCHTQVTRHAHWPVHGLCRLQRTLP